MRQPEPIIAGTTGEIPEGETLLIPAETTGTVAITVFHAETGTFYALDDECTHGAASLAEGFIEDDVIECPQHSARFCLRNGKVLSLPATVDATTHQVEIDGENILVYVGVPVAEVAEQT